MDKVPPEKFSLNNCLNVFLVCVKSKNFKLFQGSPDKEDRKEARKGRKPGRKSVKIDMKAKLERSRQSARECRARKKIRYQYLDELVADRERAVLQLRKELEMVRTLLASCVSHIPFRNSLVFLSKQEP